jgi:hypothetical protein
MLHAQQKNKTDVAKQFDQVKETLDQILSKLT